MVEQLKRIPFTPDLLAKVQGFNCGEEPWQREVSDWIKASSGQYGALDEIAGGNQVWLYTNEADELVGFGSLGTGPSLRWPGKKDPQVPVSIITMLGVDKKFWGQPPGAWEDRFSTQLLGDLIHEAKKRQQTHPLLILYVHLENLRGIAFYQRVGFVEYDKPYTDKGTGWTYKRMVLKLPQLPAETGE